MIRRMASIDTLAADFLAQDCIAVAGVSSKRQTVGNILFRHLRKRGKRVFAIAPGGGQIDGETCFPDLASLPEVPGGLLIATRGAVAEDLVLQCIAKGIRRVWMHDMFGTKPKFFRNAAAKMTSSSSAAVELCRANGIDVIPGACPMQFGGDVAHTCMRGLLRMTGALEV